MVDEGPQVTTQPAHVLGRDGKNGRGGNCGIGRRTTSPEQGDPSPACQVVDAAHHAVGGVPGDEGNLDRIHAPDATARTAFNSAGRPAPSVHDLKELGGGIGHDGVDAEVE